MKTFTSICILISLLAINTGALWGAPTAANLAGATLPASTPYSVVGRDANSRTWEHTVYERGPSGQTIAKKHGYTELAAGMHYWQNGQWHESRELIESFPGGAIAQQGQHKVVFANNLATVGAIDMQTPDGKRMRSQVLGLSYFDTASGQSVLIADVKDSQGRLYPPNVVIYPDAFTDIKADVRYTYTRAGFEQDIILHERPPGPEAYGLNPATTRLQVLTEFLNPPKPGKKQTSLTTRQGDALDEELDFGVMKMGRGKAFSLGREDKDNPVSKQWLKLEGRDFLVEEVAMPDLEGELQLLPPAEGVSLNPAAGSVRHVVSQQRLLPAVRLVQAGTNEMQLARLSLPAQGLVLDYQLVNSSQTDFTFQGDTTYRISGTVNLDGTSTFEGGTVIKYDRGASINLLSANLNWQASAYRPVIFTAMDDNSVGEAIGSGNPSGYYANPALSFPFIGGGYLTLSNFRVAYAQQALFANSGNYMFYDCQFVNCLYGTCFQPASIYFRNALFSKVMTNFYNNTSGDVDLQNVTVDSSAMLEIMGDGGVTMANCILANVTNLGNSVHGDHNGFYRCPMVGTGVTNTFYPFQAVGSGNYYLTNGCGFINAGTTTNIDSTLLADLRKKTAHPPVAYFGSTISTATNWTLKVPRDTSATPDLGYHYDSLDYLVSNVTVQATLTIINGVAVGACGANGLTVTGSLLNQGTALNWNQLVPCSLVQEQPSANATPTALISNNGNWQGINMRFTDMAMPGGVGYLLSVTDDGTSGVQDGVVTFQDCQLHGGLVTFSLGSASTGPSSGTFSMTNNLVARCQVWLSKFDSIPSSFYVNQFNNLYHGGVLNLYCDISQDSATLWQFYDNLFEGVTINEDGNDSGNPPYWSVITNGYNGYVNTTVWYGGGFFISPALLNSAGHDQFPSTADYRTGPLGSNYYPTDGGNLSRLIHAGSRSATAAGLYHYTITTDQAVEGINTVSIGYHYVAVDGNGNPIDTNGNGIPDYYEDFNGNGIFDSGDFGNWAAANWAAWFVDSRGSDWFDGLSAVWNGISGPFATINKALAEPLAGNVVNIAGGAYSENVDLRGKNVQVLLNGNVTLH